MSFSTFLTRDKQLLDLGRKKARLRREIAALKQAKFFPKLSFADELEEVVLLESEVKMILANREKYLIEVEQAIEKLNKLQ